MHVARSVLLDPLTPRERQIVLVNRGTNRGIGSRQQVSQIHHFAE